MNADALKAIPWISDALNGWGRVGVGATQGCPVCGVRSEPGFSGVTFRHADDCALAAAFAVADDSAERKLRDAGMCFELYWDGTEYRARWIIPHRSTLAALLMAQALDYSYAPTENAARDAAARVALPLLARLAEMQRIYREGGA